jgi:hypothetical protein
LTNASGQVSEEERQEDMEESVSLNTLEEMRQSGSTLDPRINGESQSYPIASRENRWIKLFGQCMCVQVSVLERAG